MSVLVPSKTLVHIITMVIQEVVLHCFALRKVLFNWATEDFLVFTQPPLHLGVGEGVEESL